MLPLVIQIPGMRAGNRIDNVTWHRLRETSRSPSPLLQQLTQRGTKSLVDTGGSGLSLAHLLGGGITFRSPGTMFDSKVLFSCKDRLFIKENVIS